MSAEIPVPTTTTDVEDQPLFAEAPPCEPGCEECEIEETRALAIEAVDWRALGNIACVHPSDMRKFLEKEISLTQPARMLIRAALAKENAR